MPIQASRQTDFRNEESRAPDRLLSRLWVLASTPLVLAIVWVGTIAHLTSVVSGLPARANQTDFSVYYTSALIMREGGNPYTADIAPAARRLDLDVGPLVRDDSVPFFLLCFEPLTKLSPGRAYSVWIGISGAALVAAMILLLHGLGGRALLLAPLMLLYQPVADHFAYARTEILILLMFVLMMRWLERGHDAAAGLILALAGALRIFPLLMGGYLLLTRRWRALWYLAIGLAVLGVVTVAALGPVRCISFVEGAVFSSQYQFAAMFLDIALSAFVSRLFWYPLGPNLAHTANLVRVAAIAVAELGVLGLTVQATLQSRDKARAFPLWVVSSVLLSPIAWVHYMVLLLIVFAQIAATAKARRCSDRAIWAMVASYLLLKLPNDLLEIARRHHSRAFFFGVGEIYFVTLVLAYLSAYWLALDDPSMSLRANAASPEAGFGEMLIPGRAVAGLK
jgi:glycosyl transferase family 87